MKKLFFLIVIFLSSMTLVHAQESMVYKEDSLALFSELFEKYLQEEDTERAIYFGEKLKSTWSSNSLEKDSAYCQLIEILSWLYHSSGNVKNAFQLLEELLPIKKAVFGYNIPDFAMMVSVVANDYFYSGNYSEGLQMETESMKIFKNTFGEENPYYATSLNNLARENSFLGNYSEAIRLEKEVLEIRKKILGTEHPDYATSLNNLASDYSRLGNYSEAIRLGMEALEIRKKILGTEHPDYVTSLNNLATYNSLSGNYSEAIRLGTEALEIKKKILGTEHPDYATSLNNLASDYSRLGNYSEAFRLGMEALEIRKNVLGSEHPDYASSLNNLAVCYFALGNYSEAIRLGTEALEIQKSVLGQEHPDYAMYLSNLAGIYSRLGNYTEAIRLGTEALEIRKKVLGLEHPDYALSLGNLAGDNFIVGNYTEALRLGSEAMEIRKKVLGKNHPLYASSLDNLAVYNSSLGHNPEAIRLGIEAIEIRKNILGTEHPDYAASLSNLACFFYSLGNYSKAWSYFKQYTELTHSFILRSFSELSAKLQEFLWSKGYADRFNYSFPSVVFRYQTNEAISELYDKTALFSKGILLNTNIAMRKLILESGDSALISRYDVLAANKNTYEKQLEKPISERFLDMDSLRSVIQQQEMQLARDSKAYGDYAKNLRINWKDVQQRLGDQNIAIEFLDFPVYDTDSIMYVALTLRKGYEHPHMIPLFENRQLKGISSNIYYTSESLYDLVWKPLEEELSGVKDIYFSPSGELHRIGIEYIPVSNTENICDRYTLHRLSSTRQLAAIQDETKGYNTVLYGGLRYDGKSGDGAENSVNSTERRSLFIPPYANVDTLGLRGSYEYLPGTKDEADQIASNLKSHSIPYSYYEGNDGTEESFKRLDGTKPRLLHIATHGFYLTEQDALRTDFARPLMLEEDRHAYHEDKPMTRSGLLLSGCQAALDHQKLPAGAEDGILTAQEISKLDLRGLDLLVLSACQTGLGDITSGEGVFGLQRGFKQAGARTIIMSLWKVSDSATRQLMTSFYGHYLSGKSKEQAFRMAKDELRKQGMPNQKKPDWAAFVMLDGIL